MADKKNKKSSSASLKIALFGVFLMAAVFFPVTILLGICMLPTAVAFVLDRSPTKYPGFAVLFLNFAGSVPALLDLVLKSYNMVTALKLVTDPAVILKAYIAAAVGWLIYINLTPLIMASLQRRALRRFDEINKRQAFLTEKWGRDVAGQYASMDE